MLSFSAASWRLWTMSRRSSGCALQNKQREAVHLIVEFEDDPETFYTVMVYQVQHFANREDLKRGSTSCLCAHLRY
ncbi:hypothetical protein CHLRE_03g156450v5 [Chlamydomonas reinhardtii]|uniref:Uncharacterized protein n=1 Tax=Chlamydomonas reinhardtii TaxID=3055 RepID=A0A2K3DW20_CHLRE|nr:uncharacterized protein CHLRE_03g156450v5 [Chlamydomonas reinhardtii]PNW84731.1 hypothetical protein CHLRE_03g156450v5 [Chlamydomonas reinhardtii]